MAKELSITELRDEKKQLQSRATELIGLARKEERKFSSAEEKEVNDAHLRMTEINVEIAGKEARNAGDGREHQVNKPMSLRKALLEMTEGRSFSDDTQKMHDIGAGSMQGFAKRGNGRNLYVPIEARSFTATGADTGKSLIETNFLNILEPLRNRMVLGEAGANFLTGLVGNIDIPSFSGSTANWEGENTAAKEGGGVFTHKTLKPKRLTSKLTVSKQLLVQDSLGVEAILRADLVASVADALEQAVLGNHAHSDNKPDGFFTGVAKTGTVFSWDGVVDLETAIDAANLGANGKYIMHTQLRGLAKKTVKKTGGALGFILEPTGEMNGYGALRTNSIASGQEVAEDIYGIIFGNWAEYLVGQWGALDLTVDPYTMADEAFVRIIVNSYWDATPRREAAFAKVYMKAK